MTTKANHMSTENSIVSRMYSVMAAIVIPLAFLMAYLIYTYVLGNPNNFEGGVNTQEPLQNNYLGVVYKGGKIVILLITFQIVLITYAVERFLALRMSQGKKDNRLFVMEVKKLLAQGEWTSIPKLCDVQQGALAQVLASSIRSFQEWNARNPQVSNEEKSEFMQIELENATQLELPLLSRNMVIISTLAQISTLIGLLGTVTGMIVAFSALARVGAPDAVGLAGGISQALITTALGISTAAVAIVLYNFFSNKIDQITYAIDEAAFSLAQYIKIKF